MLRSIILSAVLLAAPLASAETLTRSPGRVITAPIALMDLDRSRPIPEDYAERAVTSVRFLVQKSGSVDPLLQLLEDGRPVAPYRFYSETPETWTVHFNPPARLGDLEIESAIAPSIVHQMRIRLN